MKTYTIKEIKQYLESQDSLGDVHYNLKNIDKILEELKEESIDLEDYPLNEGYVNFAD